MKAFITGITGFAGSHLAEHLLQQGDAVWGCSQSGRFSADLAHLAGSVGIYPWDIQQPLAHNSTLFAKLRDFAPDWIFHLAAISTRRDCGLATPNALALGVNVTGTQNVVDLALSLPAPPRLLFVSSSYVYGTDGEKQPRVSEADSPEPQNGYGMAKLAAEGVVRQAAVKGLCAVIARSFQHTGPRQSPRMILPQWCREFAAGGAGPIRVGSLETHLDLSDVRDIVRAYRMLASEKSVGETVNVGSGRSVRSGDLFALLQDLTGSDRPAQEASPQRQQLPLADNSKLLRLTGWSPEIPLEQTVADTYACVSK